LLHKTLTAVSKLVACFQDVRASVVRVLSSPDGRWALVSTSMTASVAVAVTWLSLAANPAHSARAYEPRREQATLPYDMLLRLTGLRGISSIAAENSEQLYRSAGLIGPGIAGPLDRMLANERESATPQPEIRTLTVDKGDTIVSMLQDAGVSKTDAAAVAKAMKPLISAKSIKSGQKFKATFGKPEAAPEPATPAFAPNDQNDDDSLSKRLLSLSFTPTIERQITVHLAPEDGYFAEDVQRKLESHYQHAGATIDSSLYLAATRAGIPAGVVVEIIRMFSYEVDFQRDVHSGDSFEVFFNRFFTPEGQPAKAGDILAASMTISGKKHLLYRYEMANGDVEYFDVTGQSAKAMLMKTPVDGARISSTFGARRHPILGYTRMHKGIDFAVPQGTPVMAAGSGTVTFAGSAGEYGNLVVVNHTNNYATAYAHLSRFSVHKGDHVHQGEIVAFSGMTGLATGPHLHYEIRVNSKSVNPGAVKLASGRKLEGEELRAFFTERAHLEQLIASTPMEHRLAQADIGRNAAN